MQQGRGRGAEIRMAEDGLDTKARRGPSLEAGMFWRRKEGVPTVGTAKQGAETSNGQNALGSPAGEG